MNYILKLDKLKKASTFICTTVCSNNTFTNAMCDVILPTRWSGKFYFRLYKVRIFPCSAHLFWTKLKNWFVIKLKGGRYILEVNKKKNSRCKSPVFASGFAEMSHSCAAALYINTFSCHLCPTLRFNEWKSHVGGLSTVL